MPRVDIHTHLLPGVDDGPESMDDTVEMARIAADDGTEIILATPHQRDVMISHSIETVQNLIVEANARLRSEAGPTHHVALGVGHQASKLQKLARLLHMDFHRIER